MLREENGCGRHSAPRGKPLIYQLSVSGEIEEGTITLMRHQAGITKELRAARDRNERLPSLEFS